MLQAREKSVSAGATSSSPRLSLPPNSCATCWPPRTCPPGPPPRSCCCALPRCWAATAGCATPTSTCGSTAWTWLPRWRRSCTETRWRWGRTRRLWWRLLRATPRVSVREAGEAGEGMEGRGWRGDGGGRRCSWRADPAAARPAPILLLPGLPPVPSLPSTPTCALFHPTPSHPVQSRLRRPLRGGAPPAAALLGRPAARRARLGLLGSHLHAVPGAPPVPCCAALWGARREQLPCCAVQARGQHNSAACAEPGPSSASCQAVSPTPSPAGLC